ncbi:CD209 antigen-like protein C [Mya arenaria]|uniref:CD209 antigen-like protein C n=1 Tax=Mya arenaria TaxID=6604 RepID=UPI0022E31C72|nr:CD209 antigen-like protein C [Mya arenaria]
MAVMDITSCGQFWFTHGSYCYKAVSTLQTWVDSRDNCRSLDAELASVTDVCEHAFLVGFLTSLEWETKYVWLGVNDAIEQGTWNWLSREPFVFSAFGTGQPDDTSDQDCLSMEARFGWRDLPCSQSRRSLCKKRAK